MAPEMINAIAGLWKLVAAIAVLFSLFIFRNALQERISKLSRVKTKDAEVEFIGDSKEEIKELETASPPPKSEDEADKSFTTEDHPKSPSDENWFGKMIDAFFDKKSDEAKTAFDMLQANEVEKSKRLSNEILYNYLRYIHLSQLDAIKELEKLSENGTIRSEALYYLSICYKQSRSYEKAKEALKNSINDTELEEQKAIYFQSLTELLIEMETPVDEIIKLVLDAFSEVKTTQFQYPLYLALASAYKKGDDDLMRAVVLEKALDLRPENTDLRFRAAYAQSHAGLSQISLTNYDTLIKQRPDGTTAINNIGVEADRLNMPIRSTKYYKDAAEKGNTLAIANLAYKYIDKGFANEAQEILREAQKHENVHENVASAISALDNQKGEEIKKWEETIQDGIKQKSFLVKFTEARFVSTDKTITFGKQWKHKGETFEIEEKEGILTALWGTSSSRCKISGEISGKSAKVNLFKQVTWITDREYFDSGTPGLCYIDKQESKVYLMTLAKDKPEFMDFEIVQ